MAKVNPYDSVLDKVSKRVDSATDRIAKNFKGVKPFQKEPMSSDDLLDAYENLEMTDMQFLIQRHGEKAVNDFIYAMELHKQKRGI